MVRIDRTPAEALVDTGAVCSMIAEAFAKHLKLQIEPMKGPNHNLVSANGSRMEIVGSADLEMYIEGLIVKHTVVVARNLTPKLVLGMNFLSSFQANLNFSSNPPVLTLFDDWISIPCVLAVMSLTVPLWPEPLVYHLIQKHI